MLHKLLNWWSQFLQRIADQNQKQFGSQRMDCCKLPKGNHDSAAADPTKKHH